MKLRKPFVIAVAAGGAVVLLVAAGAYAYFFSGLRTAPKPLALASPGATASPGAGSVDLVGGWTAASGSQAGYRVTEQFAGQTSPHDAVARTTAVSGGLTVQSTGSGLRASGLRFVVELGQLKSVDQVAGFNVSNRDRLVNRSIDVQQDPEAVFEAQPLALPAGIAKGQRVTLSVPGKLTLHGVTRDVTATVQVQLSGKQVQAAGSLPVNMADYGVTAPQVPFTKAESTATIEFQLVMAKT
jgi:hypothetical protein